MIPTPRAEQLAAQLPRCYWRCRTCSLASFDPAHLCGPVQPAGAGPYGYLAAADVAGALAGAAPGVRLATLSRVDDPFEQLSNGKLDFLLQAERQAYPGELRLTTIGFAPPTLFARKGHPWRARKSPGRTFEVSPCTAEHGRTPGNPVSRQSQLEGCPTSEGSGAQPDDGSVVYSNSAGCPPLRLPVSGTTAVHGTG